MGLYSRRKGVRREQEVANWLRARGLEIERDGQPGKRDLRCKSPKLAVEVKGVARFAALAWLEQAQRMADEGELPLVLVKADRQRLAVLIDAEEFVKLIGGSAPVVVTEECDGRI